GTSYTSPVSTITTLGEPPWPPRPFKSRTATRAVIHIKLQNTPAEDRRVPRFFSLEDLPNDKRLSRGVPHQHPDALAGLLRQLAGGEVAAPEQLGDGTVLRVDMRQLGWDQSEAWDEIMKAYPYGLTDQEIAEIERLASKELPFVRLDWFVAEAS